MKKWREYLERIRGEQAARLLRLAESGKTVELDRVAADDDVIRIAFGFGDEFWRVAPTYRVRHPERDIDGGELIVEGGAPISDKAKLSFLTKRVRRVVYTV